MPAYTAAQYRAFVHQFLNKRADVLCAALRQHRQTGPVELLIRSKGLKDCHGALSLLPENSLLPSTTEQQEMQYFDQAGVETLAIELDELVGWIDEAWQSINQGAGRASAWVQIEGDCERYDLNAREWRSNV